MKDSVKYVIERILFILLTAFIILSLTYILLQLIPLTPGGTDQQRWTFWEKQVELGYYVRITDPMEAMKEGYDEVVTVAGKTTYYRAQPVMVRYFNWLAAVAKGDWGVSSSDYWKGQSALTILLTGLPYSMRLNLISILISIPLGIGLGILAALKKNTWVDSLISTVVMIFISVPSFVLISFLLIWFGKVNGWPLRWPSDADAAADPVLAFKAFVIPVMSLCFGSICGFARYTRAELTEVMSSEFLLLARTKGLTRSQAVIRHALRNSMVPIVPMIIAEFISILSGSMVLEQIYSIPGIGSVLVNALNSTDVPVIMVDMAIYTVIGLAATLIIDLSYGIVDPRIRMGARK
ncbi:MAG: ABC transporter permease [Candidatus Enteromonas sp.]|nr:ABC transporter permease [bacterium]MDD6917116.1 ABC transporter permease [bacterium]MDY6100857.1 ABC transporter permease [Candidatus Enteromonas sp.]